MKNQYVRNFQKSLNRQHKFDAGSLTALRTFLNLFKYSQIFISMCAKQLCKRSMRDCDCIIMFHKQMCKQEICQFRFGNMCRKTTYINFTFNNIMFFKNRTFYIDNGTSFKSHNLMGNLETSRTIKTC